MVGLIAEIKGWIVFQCNGIEVLIVSFLYFCLSLNVLAEILIKCVGISCHFSNIYRTGGIWIMKQNSPITENFVITLMVRCRRLLIQISRENHRNHARKFYPFNHFVGFINYKLQNNIISVRPNTEGFLYWIVHFINWWIFGYNWQNFETETKQWRDGNY